MLGTEARSEQVEAAGARLRRSMYYLAPLALMATVYELHLLECQLEISFLSFEAHQSCTTE